MLRATVMLLSHIGYQDKADKLLRRRLDNCMFEEKKLTITGRGYAAAPAANSAMMRRRPLQNHPLKEGGPIMAGKRTGLDVRHQAAAALLPLPRRKLAQKAQYHPHLLARSLRRPTHGADRLADPAGSELLRRFRPAGLRLQCGCSSMRKSGAFWG